MSDTPREATRLSDRTFDALAIGLVFIAYLAVFAVVREGTSFLDLVVASLINMLPLIPLAAMARPLIRRHLMGEGVLRQVLGHVALGTVFTFGWHWMILILVGMRDGQSFTEFSVQSFFIGGAMSWQLLQGITVYALIAALTYLRARPDLPSFVDATPEDWQENEPSMKRYFIRQGDDIQPIDVSQITSIVGADDYAEVTTADGQHLVRTTLAKFEASLDPEQFLRIHRSRIVNLHQIERAEPMGDGRMLLHMTDGEAIQTSRAGAKQLRNRVM